MYCIFLHFNKSIFPLHITLGNSEKCILAAPNCCFLKLAHGFLSFSLFLVKWKTKSSLGARINLTVFEKKEFLLFPSPSLKIISHTMGLSAEFICNKVTMGGNQENNFWFLWKLPCVVVIIPYQWEIFLHILFSPWSKEKGLLQIQPLLPNRCVFKSWLYKL